MVDSCFKLFKAKCFRKSSLKTLRDSRESIFEDDKIAINENNSHDKKYNFAISTTSFDIDIKVKPDNIINEMEHQQGLEVEPDVILRRHNRRYLRSVSTTTSNDAMSSDEDDENLDVLYPLPRVNTHERSLTEETTRQNVDNGMKRDFIINIRSDDDDDTRYKNAFAAIKTFCDLLKIIFFSVLG